MFHKPGEIVPESGIYEAIHATHRATHHVTIAAGGVFPDCNVCDGDVRFRLVRGAAPIESDEDFN
jgi:hypothetical protein